MENNYEQEYITKERREQLVAALDDCLKALEEKGNKEDKSSLAIMLDNVSAMRQELISLTKNLDEQKRKNYQAIINRAEAVLVKFE